MKYARNPTKKLHFYALLYIYQSFQYVKVRFCFVLSAAAALIFCTIRLVRTIYCIVFVIVLYNIGFCFLCFLFRNIISVTYTLGFVPLSCPALAAVYSETM